MYLTRRPVDTDMANPTSLRYSTHSHYHPRSAVHRRDYFGFTDCTPPEPFKPKLAFNPPPKKAFPPPPQKKAAKPPLTQSFKPPPKPSSPRPNRDPATLLSRRSVLARLSNRAQSSRPIPKLPEPLRHPIRSFQATANSSLPNHYLPNHLHRMSSITNTKAVVLDHLVDGEVSTRHFRLENKPISDIKDGQVLVQIVAFSHEPAQRQWIDANTDERRLYTTLIKPGETVRAPIVGRVIASKLPKYPVGTTLAGFHGWAEYAVLNEGEIFAAVPPTADGKVDLHALDVFGLAGNTAYVASAKYGKIEPGSTVVVSGAAGAIGSLLVQLAKKVYGAGRVVGIAGGKAKCDWVKTLGADECVDYKSPDWEEQLRAAVPDYADVYFDNVGGPMLDVMLQLVRPNGTIVVVGAISTYNGEALKLANWPQVIYNRLTIRGFINLDHPELITKGQAEFAKWIAEGKIDVSDIQTVVQDKIEDVPKTWLRLFDGSGKGKIISQIAA